MKTNIVLSNYVPKVLRASTPLLSSKKFTIGGSGCRLTDMAMIINYYKLYHPLKSMRDNITEMNPLQLNSLLKSIKSDYLNQINGNIDFNIIAQITNKAIVCDKITLPDNKTVDTFLQARVPVVFEIDNKHYKVQNGSLVLPLVYTRTSNHFVVAIGSSSPAGYIINDPGYQNPPRKTLTENIYYNGKYKTITYFKPGNGTDNCSKLKVLAFPGD